MHQPHKKILLLAIFLSTLLWSALSFWKYGRLLYNGLDLAIYTNVFWNTAHGNWFASSIHPPSYLGDHFEPLILPLSLLYRLWSDPRLLLFLQSLVLALAAMPLYAITSLLSRRGDGERGAPSSPSSEAMRSDGAASRQDHESWIPLLVGFAWLANPFVHNANLFEFHILSFAPPFLFSMYYYYLRRRFFPFLVFTLLSLAVREDIALLVGTFGLLFFIEWSHNKRKKESRSAAVPPSGVVARAGTVSGEAGRASAKAVRRLAGTPNEARMDAAEWLYGIIAIMSSALWLLLSFSIISHYAPTGSYKFLSYYSWVTTHPITGFFLHLTKPTVFAMVLGLLMPFLFLPLLRPRFLILALPPFLQFALTSGGGGSVVLQTHYAILFLPALFLGTIEVLTLRSGGTGGGDLTARSVSEHGEVPQGTGPRAMASHPTTIVVVLLVVATLYTALTMGPLLPALKKIFITPPDQQFLQTKKEFLARIPKDTPIATTSKFLTPLASRKTIASLHYAFIGVKQYSDTPYTVPDEIQTVLIDFDEFKTYQLQFARHPLYARFYTNGNARIQKFIKDKGLSPLVEKESIALFTREGNPLRTDASLEKMNVAKEQGGLELDGIRSIVRVIDR